MKTHFQRERGAEAAPAAAASKALGWRTQFGKQPRRANDSIHSFMPTSPTHLPTSTVPSLPPSPTPIYTHCLFSKKANQLRTAHPLSHIITRPLWKCVSLQTLDVTTSRSPPCDRCNKRGLVMAAKETVYAPSYTLLLFTSYSFTTNASVRQLCDYYNNL